MLRYPEVYTNLIFVSIFTISLELNVAKNIYLDTETNDDGFFVTCISYQVCYNKEDLPTFCQHSANKMFNINYLQQSVLSVDKVTYFYLLSPELLSTIDMIGNYDNWF